MAAPYRVMRANRALSLLVAGEALSSLSDWLVAVVLTVLVYDISHSGTTVSLLTFTRLAPYALVLPWSGFLLDRANRRLLMTGLGFGRALCMLGLLLVDSPAALALAFPLVFASASLSCLLRPTVNATVPDLVAEQEVIGANSVVSQMDGAAHIVGPALGGFFILHDDPRLALLAAAAGFAMSGAAMYLTRMPAHLSDRAGPHLSLSEVFAGFRFLFRENEGVLAALAAAAAGIALLAGAFYVLAVVLCTTTFHFGGQAVGWLDALYGAGGFVGSLLMATFVRGRRIAHLFVGGAALHCLGVVFLAISPAGALPFACIALVGIADVAAQVSGTTILQAAAPRETLGRTFTAFEATLVAAMLLGALVAGPMVRVATPRVATLAFAVAGAGLLLASVARLGRLEEALGVRVFLRGVPLLSGLSRPLLDELAPHFDTIDFPSGTSIVREGEPGDHLYIIRSGEVEVLVGDRVVRHLGTAGYFGEVALLHDVPRTATVRARTPVTLFALGRDAFQRLLHEAEELRPRLAKEAETYQRFAPTAPVLHH